MAPLYRRYIPPNDHNVDETRQLPAKQELGLGIRFTDVVEDKKRKRDDRSQEKPRKAKKSADIVSTRLSQDISSPTKTVLGLEQGIERSGEFAHIKSAKKRHKLEKEARKARKDAEKAANASVTQENPVQYHERAVDDVPRQENLEPAGASGREKTDLMPRFLRDRRRPDVSAGTVIAENEQTDSSAEIAADSEDPHLKKHTSLLNKYQKSKDIAARIRLEGALDADQSTLITEKPILKDLTPFDIHLNEEQSVAVKPVLPDWLAHPKLISNTEPIPFSDLGLQDGITRRLSEAGFQNALPVQQALLPHLLPPGAAGAHFQYGTESVLPDLAISAPTGSGKTLAYLLPMLESLNNDQRTVREIRGLVIVPTRELVSQVALVATKLAKGSSVQIGTASGAGKLSDEQRKLISMSYDYDPDAYKESLSKAHMIAHPPDEDSIAFDTYVREVDQLAAQDNNTLSGIISGSYGHLARHEAAVDVLICTPGRLLEHISSTKGFHLSGVRWLVLDEVDKLLDEQYDDLLDRLMEALTKERAPQMRDARETYLREQGIWDDLRERRVRKVVLSATMTTDVSKLASLRLQRPQMIVVGSSVEVHAARKGELEQAAGEQKFELPPGLKEYYTPTGDGQEKPIKLLRLLEDQVLHTSKTLEEQSPRSSSSVSSEDQSDSKTSGEDESSDSDHTSLSNESESSTDSTDDYVMSDSEDDIGDTGSSLQQEPSTIKGKELKDLPTVLVFVANTQAALRLTHLIKDLRPDLASSVFALTRISQGNTALSRATSDSPCIVIATDRAGRGLDRLAGRTISHVIQYDVPRSLVSYVHRVGRTARAGRSGQAWTLYTSSEARWFIKEIVRSSAITRTNAIEKVRLAKSDEASLQRYKEALAAIKQLVVHVGRK